MTYRIVEYQEFGKPLYAIQTPKMFGGWKTVTWCHSKETAKQWLDDLEFKSNVVETRNIDI